MFQYIFDRIEKILYSRDRDELRQYLKSLQGAGFWTTTIFEQGWVYLEVRRSGEALTFNGPTSEAKKTLELVYKTFAESEDAE